MTTPSNVNAGYAKGWVVNAVNTRWHDGTLTGTQAILVRTAGQPDREHGSGRLGNDGGRGSRPVGPAS
jgi:hypothetical protein